MRIHRHRQRKPKFEVPVYKANESIIAPEVRVIDENGVPLGVLPIAKAIATAREREMDLVEVSPKAEPPVCRITDYGQFKYQKEKEARKQKAQSKEVEIKGVRLSLRIGDHDLETRHQQAKSFLEDGDKVKIEIILRGREKGHQDIAREVVKKFMEILKTDFPIRVEQEITYQAGRLTAIVGRI
ncbi:translation initiation factor IF-3 [Candidatus Uhrbacteria bacterium RIFCSPHIGHO2_01_FULL_63_20]|uniref:Translation initiation factor IF-3 n=1 Tax=Candidatus Uhrbacteria bacterium RIFCSPHIGHO2_01_FULL_63_20 TaxID=1802385 RepID=A0A1F7TNL3_9BACT|nr:MAG: translation initiation factor IF-3 [Candidatus Uhrbacteria bacterium RIFCSPHIGHO2_01_FULL_63_20]